MINYYQKEAFLSQSSLDDMMYRGIRPDIIIGLALDGKMLCSE
jgi:hypothetical protein